MTRFEPPPWPVIRFLNLVVALFCFVTAIIAETRWIAMADMAAAGSLVAAYIWIGRIMQMQAVVKVLNDHLSSLRAHYEQDLSHHPDRP